MAYNSYFPATYQPMTYYGQPSAYPFQTPQQSQQQSQHQPIQQSGFVLVQSEQEARSYPVAPGNSVTFKDESAPYCYVKTMGFNSLDRPTFERYRLVKEDMPAEAQESPKKSGNASEGNRPEYALKSEFDALRDEVEALKAAYEKKPTKKAKAEEVNDAE